MSTTEHHVQEEVVARGLLALLAARQPTESELHGLQELVEQFFQPNVVDCPFLITDLFYENGVNWTEVRVQTMEWVSQFWTDHEQLRGENQFQADMDAWDKELGLPPRSPDDPPRPQ